jgi:hypothetical protein
MLHLSTLPGSLWPEYRTPSTTTTSAAKTAISPSHARSAGGSTAGAAPPSPVSPAATALPRPRPELAGLSITLVKGTGISLCSPP